MTAPQESQEKSELTPKPDTTQLKPTTKTHPEYVKRRYLSVSTLLSFARCPRKYFHEKSGLREPEEPLAPQYGTALHAAAPVALETEDLSAAMKAFLSVWEGVESRMDDFGDEDPKRNRRTAERSLKHFIHTHAGSKSIYKLLPAPEGALETVDEKTSKYEVPWALDIGLPIPLTGRFDAFCQHRDTGEKWIWELKSKSNFMGGLNARFFDAHEMNPQNTTYALVGQTMLDEPIQGVMVEGILVDKTKVDNMCQPILVQQHHLADIKNWLFYTGKRLLEMEDTFLDLTQNVGMGVVEAADRSFIKDFTGCTPYPLFYFPGFRCEFADLCRVPDFKQLTVFYKVVPDHDFLKVTAVGQVE